MLLMRNVFFIVLVLTFLAMGCDNTKPITTEVQVEQGIVEGTFEDNLTVFKGIPFAQPPVGDLRWRAPQPAKKWEGILKTNKYAPGPMQGGTPPSGKSEDCLYLNIWWFWCWSIIRNNIQW